MDFSIDIGWPLVPPGTYTVSFVSHRTRMMFARAPKLELRFRIQDTGEYHGLDLPRWYNVARIGKNGSFKVGKRSNFVLDYAALFGTEGIRRLDRCSMEPFRNSILSVDVVTVEKNSEQRTVPDALRYSKVSALIAVVGP